MGIQVDKLSEKTLLKKTLPALPNSSPEKSLDTAIDAKQKKPEEIELLSELEERKEPSKRRNARYHQAKLNDGLLVKSRKKAPAEETQPQVQIQPEHVNLLKLYFEMIKLCRKCMKEIKDLEKDEINRLNKKFEQITKDLAKNAEDGGKFYKRAQFIAIVLPQSSLSQLQWAVRSITQWQEITFPWQAFSNASPKPMPSSEVSKAWRE